MSGRSGASLARGYSGEGGAGVNIKTRQQGKLIGAGLQWDRDGDCWLLRLGRRRLGRVVPDAKWPGMWRSVMPDGSLSDMANITWAKDAVVRSATRDLDYVPNVQSHPRNTSKTTAVLTPGPRPSRKTGEAA